MVEVLLSPRTLILEGVLTVGNQTVIALTIKLKLAKRGFDVFGVLGP